MADPRNRRDSAATIARRLAAGVGSRVALPRNAVGRVGQARLAKQTGFAATERRGFLGRALFAAAKTGGRNVSGFALRRENVAQAQRLHSRGRDFAGAR